MTTSIARVLLVGAEGVSEAEGCSWLRDATKSEQKAFVALVGYERYQALGIDHNGRPYFLKAVDPGAPQAVWEKAGACYRVVRLTP